jgi:phage-related protein (TIGR01555 family)
MSELKLRSITIKDQARFVDSLTNVMTGMGTSRDQRTGSAYCPTILSQQTIAYAYRGSGLMRKIINIPPLDMVREGRSWNAEQDQITAIEAEEKRIRIWQTVRQAEVLRGLGGGAILMGLPGLLSSPAPEAIQKGQLAFLHPLSRWQLSFSELEDDPASPTFNQPRIYTMMSNQGQVKIHPSRIVPFVADYTPPLWSGAGLIEEFWGESKVAQVLDAVTDCDTARGAFASLISKARNVRIGIPDLLLSTTTTDGEAAFRRRMELFTLGESMFRATVYDTGKDGKSGETIDDVSYNFAGIKDVMDAFGMWASAISDIPATRLLGRAPEGMNSSGESQQKDWNKLVGARQKVELSPCLDRIDRYLVMSAIGKADDKIWASFDPLDQPSDKERAETFNTLMDGIVKLQQTRTIPDVPFARGVQSLLIDEGTLPELEQALAEITDDNERWGALPDGEEDVDLEGGDLSSAGGGNENDLPARRAANDAFFTDAKPKPLYVQRKLLNAGELIKWAKEQGFDTTIPAEDIHVTVLYSRQPVDPMKMGETWSGDENGNLTVKPGGPRAVERLGENAVVLLFAASELNWRHRSMIEAGGSHDYGDYQPHVTISYGVPIGADLDAIKPYAGRLLFGPEIFEPLDLDWKSKVKEDAGETQ